MLKCITNGNHCKSYELKKPGDELVRRKEFIKKYPAF